MVATKEDFSPPSEPSRIYEKSLSTPSELSSNRLHAEADTFITECTEAMASTSDMEKQRDCKTGETKRNGRKTHPGQRMTATGERKSWAEIMESEAADASSNVEIKKTQDRLQEFETHWARDTQEEEAGTPDESETPTYLQYVDDILVIKPDQDNFISLKNQSGEDTHSLSSERPRRNEPWQTANKTEFESRNEVPRRNEPWTSTSERDSTANSTHELSENKASQLLKFLKQQSIMAKESIKLLEEIKTMLHRMPDQQSSRRRNGREGEIHSWNQAFKLQTNYAHSGLRATKEASKHSLSQETEQDGNMSSRSRMSYQKWQEGENKMDKATTSTEFVHKMQRAKRASKESKTYGSADLNREKALKAKRRAAKQCFSCGEQGHFARNCETARSQPHEKRDETRKQQNNEEQHEQNNKQQKRGTTKEVTVLQLKEITQQIHQLREKICINKGNEQYRHEVNRVYSSAEKVFKIDATLNGVNVKATLDSGASNSMINLTVAKQLQLKLDSTVLEVVRLADGSEIDVIRQEGQVEISVEKNKTLIQMMIIPNGTTNEVLLGLDWFITSGAVFYPRGNTLHFIQEQPDLLNEVEQNGEEQGDEEFNNEVDNNDSTETPESPGNWPNEDDEDTIESPESPENWQDEYESEIDEIDEINGDMISKRNESTIDQNSENSIDGRNENESIMEIDIEKTGSEASENIDCEQDDNEDSEDDAFEVYESWREISVEINGPFTNGNYWVRAVDDFTGYQSCESIQSKSVKNVKRALARMFRDLGTPVEVKTTARSPFNTKQFRLFAATHRFHHQQVRSDAEWRKRFNVSDDNKDSKLTNNEINEQNQNDNKKKGKT